MTGTSTSTSSSATTAAPSSHPGRALAGRAAWVTFAGAVVVQLSFALNGGNIPLTVASVVLLTATATLHATSVGGWKFALGMLGIVAVLTWAAEAVGIATGFPFGEYAYTGSLGPEIAGVSLLVLLAWLTLAYPSYVVANRLVGPGTGWRKAARIGLAGFALTAWDVFLDPQMVEAGNWGWANPEPSLPGTPGIPLTNYGGWLLTAVLIACVLDAWHTHARRAWDAAPLGAPDRQRADRVPYAVYLWTYVSCIIGNASFWERPSVAVAGGILMGLVAVPLVLVLRRGRAGVTTTPAPDAGLDAGLDAGRRREH
ncbi:carotenoid biosynthesis protein [Serinibacter arcticus]|uniref:Carotenoid biosynthesis protein n=1 Tax=Serinibacter arcticus TaxID=1655435 RepID=A0A2U1ZVK9_9MICO|nr:carotenoid biosynthesis protein [Serinibacter arcticus]PWD51004.1 carotenoid biosynthesis protein [Serinibacter arcticus]